MRAWVARRLLRHADEVDLVRELRARSDAMIYASGKGVVETDNRLEIKSASFAWFGTDHAMELLMIKLEQSIEIQDLTEPHKPKGAT